MSARSVSISDQKDLAMDASDREAAAHLSHSVGKAVRGFSCYEPEGGVAAEFSVKMPTLFETFWPILIHLDDSSCLRIYSEVSSTVRMTVESVAEPFPPSVLVSGIVTSVRIATGQISLLEVKETPWAATFVFDHTEPLGVALGETNVGGEIEMIPDSFLVIRDRTIAERYSPDGSTNGAWGKPLPL